tara:strand:+ start:582 stop:767 length:186 start_codon:yes stop_codon:yes gene_type:complete
MNKSLNQQQKILYNSLVCPISRGLLKFNEGNQELVSEAAAVAFPVRNGIPILLIDEARKLD